MNTPKKMKMINQFVTPKRDKLSVDELPSPLMKVPVTPRYIPKPSSLDDLDRKFPAIDDEDEMCGKAGLVYLAQSNPGNKTVAIKRQYLPNPNDRQSTGYRELLIMQHLHSKIKGNHNFIKLLDWNKCWMERTPPRGKSKNKKENIQCMNLIMNQAGEPLQSLIGKGKTISLYIFKQILFQVLFSLAKAQEACEFMHNDLHLKNILIDNQKENSLTPKYYSYEDSNGTWFVDSTIIITIVDFGLSRITLDDDTVIHNNVHQHFLPSSDIERLGSEFSKFKISSWSPYLNDIASSSEEKEQRGLKRKLMSKMKKGHSASKLIQDVFFDSMKSIPPNLISKQECVTPPQTLSNHADNSDVVLTPLRSTRNQKINDCSPISPVLSNIKSISSGNDKSCLGDIPAFSKVVASSIHKIHSKLSSKTKLSKNKENLDIQSSNLLKKRKSSFTELPLAKRRKL